MFKNMSSVRLGIFIFLGIALLVLAVFLIGQKNALFSSTFNVKAYFKDVQGLRSGATVRLSGIDVGSVNNINIVNDTTGRVDVSMDLQTDIRRFIRTDTKATIETEGLVGSKVVVLKMGSSNAEPIKNGGYIQSEEPVGFSAIIAQTEGIMEYTKNMTRDLSQIVEKVNKGNGSIGKLINNDELYNNASNLTKQADSSLKNITAELNKITGLFDTLGLGVKDVIDNVDETVIDAKGLISNVKKGQGLLGALMVKGKYDSTIASTLENIHQTSIEANISASRLAENMEALKHNWLFKGYFENRGYWDESKHEEMLDKRILELNEKIKDLSDKIKELKKVENKN